MKLLQIDTCLGTGSTGRITESIAQLAINNHWDCYIIHGARYVRHPSCMIDIQSVSKIGEYIHYVEGLLFDDHGLASRRATRRVINDIRKISPDIIHLHCIHGYYLNYKILFNYLNSLDIPIVWTFHDCWAFTGHCAHFVTAACEKWKSGCYSCPRKSSYPKAIVDKSKRNYDLKKKLFIANNNLHIVPVSNWLADLTRESFFKAKDIRVIRNGVDLTIFKPLNVVKEKKRFRILGVSGVWTKSKGLEDFILLRDVLSNELFDIVMVGLNREQISSLPEGIIGIEHTDSIEELAILYNSSDVFFNPTYADTFPTVNLEALACGTPVITYKTGGSPEAVSSDTGWVVNQGDLTSVIELIKKMSELSKEEIRILRTNCRKRAMDEFDKTHCFEKYLALYNELIKQ